MAEAETIGAVVSTVNARVELNGELALELSTLFARHQYCVAVWRLKPTGTAAEPFWPTFRFVADESKVPSEVEHELSLQTSKVTLPKSSGSGSAKPAESVGVVELMKAPSLGAERVAAVGLWFGVRFVTLVPPYVAAALPARSVTDEPLYVTTTASRW